MIIKFKDGHEIEFEQSEKIWLSKSVIWEDTKLNGSMDELRELKSKIAHWFSENAPEEMRARFTARLPLQNEIKLLSIREGLAYKEGSDEQSDDYFLGDENSPYPVRCHVGISIDEYSWFFFYATRGNSGKGDVRLCLEEKL